VNAAVQSLVFEGLAADDTEARILLARGEAILRPAQDHGIVTPLAQVVSASMLLGAVRHHSQVTYGALLEGSAPALRFGSRQPECRERLEFFNEQMSRSLAPCLRRVPVDLAEVIRRAVALGDDCHSRTAGANELLLSSVDGLEPGIAADLRALPAFVLPLLMAGAAAAMAHHRNPMAALGGNGVDFGVRRYGESTWRQMAAAAPVQDPGHGQSLPGGAAAAQPGRPTLFPLPAIGDSVLIDYCGLGGQVDEPALRRTLLNPQSGLIDPARIAATRCTPAFNLAVLDSAGESGLIGRGVYHPPAELFA